MNEPRWLTAVQARMLHAESLRLFGGRAGLRDVHPLESALARPMQRFAYGDDPDLFDLAAEYAFVLARNHAFVDGNKRVALLSVRAFLFMNGFRLEPDQIETVTTFENLDAGNISLDDLAAWINQNARRRA